MTMNDDDVDDDDGDHDDDVVDDDDDEDDDGDEVAVDGDGLPPRVGKALLLSTSRTGAKTKQKVRSIYYNHTACLLLPHIFKHKMTKYKMTKCLFFKTKK